MDKDKVLLTDTDKSYLWGHFREYKGEEPLCWEDVMTLGAQQKLMRLLEEPCDCRWHKDHNPGSDGETITRMQCPMMLEPIRAILGLEGEHD